jgi:hypothetical protein
LKIDEWTQKKLDILDPLKHTNVSDYFGGVCEQSFFKVLRQNLSIEEYHVIFSERCLKSM